MRSRGQWIEDGKKCSKYFMRSENRTYKTKCTTTPLKDEIKMSKQQEILDECKRFNENLYSKSTESIMHEK